MNKVVVAYRENDLFRKYVPEILFHVPQWISVETIKFPSDADLEEIRRVLTEVLSNIDVPFLYLYDETCSVYRIDVDSLRVRLPERRSEWSKSLDTGFHEIIEEIFSTRDFAEILKKVACLIIEDPKVVRIVADNITDHLYGFRDHIETRDIYGGAIFKFARWLGEILQGLYGDADINIIDALHQAVEQCGQNEEALIVADRHCGIYDVMDYGDITTWPHKCKLLLLPFESGISHLITLGKIEEQFDSRVLYEKTLGRLISRRC